MTRPRDVGLYAGGLLFQQAIAFTVGIAVARWLGPQGYGQLSLVRAIYGVAVILAPLGLDLSLLRRLGESSLDEADRLAEVRVLRRIVAMVNMALLVAVVSLVGPWLQVHVYRRAGFAMQLDVAFAALPFAADLAVLIAASRALDRVAAASLASLYLQPLIRTAALAALLALGLGASGVLGATAIGLACADLALSLALSRRRPEHSAAIRPGSGLRREPLAKLFGYSGWMAAMLLAYGALKLIDVLVLGHFRPAREVGDYAALSVIAQLIGLYPVALSQTLGPTVARLHAQSDKAAVRRELGRYVRTASLACAPLLAGVAVFGPWLDLVFGAKYRFDPALCLVLALGAYVSGVFGPMSASLSMTGRHRLEFAILLAGAAATLAGCLWLAPGYGGLGVGVASLGGYLLVNGARTAASAKIMGGLDLAWADFAAPLACLALAYGVRTAAERLGGHDWATGAAAAVGLGAGYVALYGVVLLSAAEREGLAALSRRLRRSGAGAAPCRS